MRDSNEKKLCCWGFSLKTVHVWGWVGGGVLKSLSPYLCPSAGGELFLSFFSFSFFSSGFVHLWSFCFLVYSSIGFSHGKRRCPWRAAQQESLYHGWVPEEIWILKWPLPIHPHSSALFKHIFIPNMLTALPGLISRCIVVCLLVLSPAPFFTNILFVCHLPSLL